ncbi:MAG: SDR family NAD(P)-dependent oxidoreductase [Alphaproteobacteria bacterium]|nr:SDR family NAD(P)-dependent oxidoreductase [Alphaproteobacteria bacterium]
MSESVVAITGGTGFVGTHLVKRLVAEGHKVRLLVRSKAPDCQLSHRNEIELVHGDLDNLSALRKLTNGANTVIHLASKISAKDRDEFDAVNVDGTRNLAATAKAAEVGQFIFISSLAAREAHLSAYAASKKQAEQELINLTKFSEMPWVIVRPPAVYGPGDKATLPLLQALTQKFAVLPGRAEARFSLIYVDDLVDAISGLIGDEETLGQTVELDDGTPGGYDWPSLAKIAGEVGGQQVRPVFLPRTVASAAAGAMELGAKIVDKTPALARDKVHELYHINWVCQNTRLQTAGTWAPKTRFSEGFRKTVAWYRSEGWL